MSDMDIVVVGELNVDMIFTGVPSLPELGKEKLADDMSLTMGSASAILSCNVARLGLRTGFIGQLGQDSYGDLVLATLKARHIDTSGIIINGNEKTGITVILAYPDDYAMVTHMGAMESFDIGGVDFDTVRRARHLHLSSYFLQPAMRKTCKELFMRAKNLGLTTSLDPGWDPAEEWSDDIIGVLPFVDVFMPNEQEAINIAHASDIESALNILSEYSSIIVATLGSKGSICSTSGKLFRAGVYSVKAVEASGAGDSFSAGFIFGWLTDGDIPSAIRKGAACGALAVTKTGGITASPTADELEQFLAEHPENIMIES